MLDNGEPKAQPGTEAGSPILPVGAPIKFLKNMVDFETPECRRRCPKSGSLHRRDGNGTPAGRDPVLCFSERLRSNC